MRERLSECERDGGGENALLQENDKMQQVAAAELERRALEKSTTFLPRSPLPPPHRPCPSPGATGG